MKTPEQGLEILQKMCNKGLELITEYNCLPLCDGRIEVYRLQIDKFPAKYREYYVCSRGEKDCPILKLRVESDTLSEMIEGLRLSFEKTTDIEVLNPEELKNEIKRIEESKKYPRELGLD